MSVRRPYISIDEKRRFELAKWNGPDVYRHSTWTNTLDNELNHKLKIKEKAQSNFKVEQLFSTYLEEDYKIAWIAQRYVVNSLRDAKEFVHHIITKDKPISLLISNLDDLWVYRFLYINIEKAIYDLEQFYTHKTYNYKAHEAIDLVKILLSERRVVFQEKEAISSIQNMIEDNKAIEFIKYIFESIKVFYSSSPIHLVAYSILIKIQLLYRHFISEQYRINRNNQTKLIEVCPELFDIWDTLSNTKNTLSSKDSTREYIQCEDELQKWQYQALETLIQSYIRCQEENITDIYEEVLFT